MRLFSLALTCVLLGLAPAASVHAVEPGGELARLYERIASDLRGGGALRVTVYVALCDNDSQGIVPVKNRSICDGEQPEKNIYWRIDGGIAGVLRGQRYRELEYSRLDTGPIAIRARYGKTFAAGAALRARGVARVPVEITALAYRGAHIGDAMFDFVRAVHRPPSDSASAPHVLGYIGHNYFLDPYDARELARAKAGKSTLEQAVFALSCLGDDSIRPEITRPNAHLLVLNRGLTYPGAWTLGGLLEGLALGEDPAGIHRLATHRFAEGRKKPPGSMRRVFAFGS